MTGVMRPFYFSIYFLSLVFPLTILCNKIVAPHKKPSIAYATYRILKTTLMKINLKTIT